MKDPQVDRKTSDAKEVQNKKTNVIQSEKVNVLHGYRSYTYNFTLAGLRKEYINDPSLYINKPLEFIVLKSGGKGITGLSTDVSGVSRKVGEQVTQVDAGFDQGTVEIKKGIFKEDKAGDSDLVRGFNQNSPGRFDMFIDSVEIETIMAFTEDGGTTLPTSIKFNVLEPYSINGFIEALHVAAVASGYASYVDASFLLKMEFIGYEDSESITDPRIVENSTRYFPIKFAGIEVETGEKGTSYRCAAIPWNDIAFGQANKLKRSCKMEGNYIKDILKDLVEKINSQIRQDDQKTKQGTNVTDTDTYEIAFPVRTEDGFNYDKVNLIGESKLESIMRNSSIFKFEDPGKEKQTQSPQANDSDPERLKLHPNSGTPPVIQFSEGRQISEIITAVIRDSNYVRNILDNLKIDSNGFIDYFAIKAEVFNKGTLDPVSRKPYQRYRYSVIPYKVHFTKIPGLGSQKYNSTPISKLSVREYNYIYTGKNVDVLNFKLNFDTLFFEGIPVAMANNDQPGAINSAGQSKTSEIEIKDDDIRNQQTDEIPVGQQLPMPVQLTPQEGSGSQPSTDPYFRLARNLHDAIVDSKTSLVKGEIEIIGDPLYLVTGGIGNFNPVPGDVSGITDRGEADYLAGQVLITINFRNPIDIQPLELGGMYYFETEKLPFSGVYQVLKTSAVFNNGEFKQRLDIIRFPGQIIGKTRETVPAEKFIVKPDPNKDQSQSTTQGVNQGGAAISDGTAVSLLNRGLPSPGLPGILSNFVGATGGLGGLASNLLNQVSGAVSRGLNLLSGSNSVFGGSIPGGINQLASGLRMQSSGLISSLQSNLSNASSLLQASNTLQNGFGISNVTESLASDIVDRKKSVLDRLSVAGSGIGEGASTLVNRVGSIDQATGIIGNYGKSIVNVAETSLIPGGNFSLSDAQSGNLGFSQIATVASLGSSGASKLISSVGDKSFGLNSSLPNDPTAIAAKFGINPSQLSGLSGELQSKVLDQLNVISDKIPDNVDLSNAAARGLSLEVIPIDKLQNIPATAPYLSAPKPEVDRQFLNELAKTGGPQALANAFGVSDVGKISGELLPAGQLNSLLSESKGLTLNALSNLTGNVNLPDVTALGGKLSGAKNLINSVSPNLGSLESNLSSVASTVGDSSSLVRNLSNSVTTKFGSNSIGQSPLNKLISYKG